jgi:hypothetical protein
MPQPPFQHLLLSFFQQILDRPLYFPLQGPFICTTSLCFLLHLHHQILYLYSHLLEILIFIRAIFSLTTPMAFSIHLCLPALLASLFITLQLRESTTSSCNPPGYLFDYCTLANNHTQRNHYSVSFFTCCPQMKLSFLYHVMLSSYLFSPSRFFP